MNKNTMLITIILLISFSACFTLLNADQTKSVPKAMLFSAILPGAGQLYIENQTSASIFLATEALLWFGKTRFDNERKWTENSYKKFATEIAGADPNTSGKKYNILQGYLSSEQYNDEIILAARNYFLLIYNDPEAYEQYLDTHLFTGNESWDWKTDENRLQFKDMRIQRQKYLLYSNFTFGSLLLNRLISIVDAAKSTKANNKHHFYTVPDPNGKGISLNYEYNF
ncbi:MAG TPA: hypothetical protein PKZ69_08070 [Candidatus Cloacimonadota bacterium]|nr:hypothetical protein [Candidatus Cloacimonadota bacterium]HOQ80143.1 hypothetical protein [Candidatus Cloacimonadota bacterium]HPK41566.1 hypothetical protein [Candidatus Cloacimonadota bacterium]